MHYLLSTAIAIFFWSSLAALASLAVVLPPFFTLAVGLLIGGMFSLPKWRTWTVKPSLLLIGTLGIFGYHFLLFMALRLAPPVNANLLNYLWPLFILLFTPLFFREFHLTKLHVLGAVISFLGAFLLIYDDRMVWSIDFVAGYILAVLAALVWAIYSLASKKISHFSSATVGLFCLISGGLSLVAHFAFEQRVIVESSEALILIALGIGPLGVAFYCWDHAVKKGDPRVIATMSYLTPLLSTLLLMFVNNTSLSPTVIAAMIAIVSGAFIANVNGLFKNKSSTD